MRLSLTALPVTRLFSSIALSTIGAACGLIEPVAPDGQVVLPLEAGASVDATPVPDDASPTGPAVDAGAHEAASPDAEPDAAASPDATPEHDAAAHDAAPEHDAVADATAQDDAGTGWDAALGDAGPMNPPDASCDGTACADASAATCAVDAQCGASEYCSVISHACAPRCDATGACIGPKLAASNNRLVTDGKHVCYAGDSLQTGVYTLFAWDGSAAEPTAIGAGANARALLIADGYCYYHADTTLQRAPVSGGNPEVVQPLATAPRRSWLSAAHVWWSVITGEELQLFRLARSAGSAPELIFSGPAAELWEASNSTHLFRRFNPSYAKCAIAMAPIDDPSSVTVIPMSFSKNCTGAFWASEESIVFTQYEPVRHFPFRIDLANPGQEIAIGLYSVENLMYQVRGASVYGQRVVDGSSVPGVPSTVSYWRAPLAGGPDNQGVLLFTPTPGTAAFLVEPYDFKDNVYRTFAVLDDLRLIYQHKTEHRLLLHTLPAEPTP